MSSVRLAVLLSGRGSNFAAIRKAIDERRLDAKIVAVISNRPDAAGLQLAAEWGLPTHALDHKTFSRREEHEAAVRTIIDASRADFIILAGYMRLLSASFVAAYPRKILNIHPSLLPAFPGTDAQHQALAHGVKISGCTVHFVDETLDGGPIIVQRAVEVRNDDTEEMLAARILEQEHQAYVEAIAKVARGYRVEGRRVIFTE